MVHFHCKVSFDLSEFQISWSLTGTPFVYPIVVLCHEVPATLVLQDWSLHMPLWITDGVDLGVGQLIILVMGLGSCRVS